MDIRSQPRDAAIVDPVGPSWLVTVRWTTALAGLGAVLVGRSVFGSSVPLLPTFVLLAVCALSNLWLMWRIRAHFSPVLVSLCGGFVCADVGMLTWLLFKSGGVLNPASIFYLAQIVVAALVLGRKWTWIVTALGAAGYAALFLAPNDALRTAQGMHPEIALHMRGMWLAFSVTGLIIALLVTRLATAIERRDRALQLLREDSARAARLAGLATLATGAAHELSTPLATIVVAARELEKSLTQQHGNPEWQQDARLIRAESDRCRHILDAMAGRSGESVGETPRAASIGEIVQSLRRRLGPSAADRIRVDIPDHLRVVWPIDTITRALDNLVQNALQASIDPEPVDLRARLAADGWIDLVVTDRGAGMSAADLARAGEPFFTTKPAGAGTGLGLFVARSSVEQLGGRFSLASVPTEGTTATMRLPQDVIAAKDTSRV